MTAASMQKEKVGDFTGKQFSATEVADKTVEQYGRYCLFVILFVYVLFCFVLLDCLFCLFCLFGLVWFDLLVALLALLCFVLFRFGCFALLCFALLYFVILFICFIFNYTLYLPKTTKPIKIQKQHNLYIHLAHMYTFKTCTYRPRPHQNFLQVCYGRWWNGHSLWRIHKGNRWCSRSCKRNKRSSHHCIRLDASYH